MLLYAALLALGSLLPSRNLPTLSLWTDLFAPDKVAHFGAYAILAVLLSVELYPRFSGKGIVYALLLAGALGGLLEILQGLTGLGREADPVDMVANLLGALLGGAAFWLAAQIYKRRFPTAGGVHE